MTQRLRKLLKRAAQALALKPENLAELVFLGEKKRPAFPAERFCIAQRMR
jgi:hypothetical protein